MEKKLGVYICGGCGLGDALDLDSLAKVATKEFKVPVCKQHSHLCGAEGAGLIKADVDQGGVNSIVVAACSPRVMTDVFDYGPAVLLERVNLREQVAWSHPAGDEDTQMLADDQLRIGLNRMKEMEPPSPFEGENLSKRILVVGGGLTGMSAANEAAKAGCEVVLVEKEAELGGYLRQVAKLPPSQPPYEDLQDVDLPDLIGELTGRSSVMIYTGAQVASIAGAPCMFDVTIQQNGSQAAERVGAVVLATGSVPYDARKLDHLGYGKLSDVITAADLEAQFKAGGVTRPSNGQPVGSAAFVLCAGSRDAKHLAYCSAACCVESLKQAKMFKTANPEMPVYIFYQDMRAVGQYELFYKQLQKDGVIFVRGTITGISDDGAGALTVSAEDELTRSPVLSESVDLVVLATGMVPTSALGQPYKAQQPQEGEEAAEVPADTILVSNLLNLQYRQGPEVPALKYGFPDSHFICFPYESRRTGIYPAGTVRAPMDYARAVEDGTGAALKAIQCMQMTSQGMALHPRAGDLSYPEFFMQRCTQC
ncbi:MAG TPA: heterodisulfide reductase subunit A, partial [Syntrophobacteraceae bacterium]|nr:heterodisulfide reductase subunit A [Syntrophobacteraceae bacterium]